MEQTRDLMVCFEFAEPIDITLRGDALNARLRGASILDASKSFARFFGHADRSAVIGMRVMDLFAGKVPAWFIGFGREIVRSGFRSREGVLPAVLPDGREVQVRLHMQNILADGFLLRQWLTLSDVTEEVRRERRARKDEKTKAVALEAAGLFSYEANFTEGRVRFEPEGLSNTACSGVDATMREWAAFIAPEDVAEAAPKVRAYLAGELDKLHARFRLPGAHGGQRWIEVWETPTEWDDSGAVAASTGVYQDVTDEVELAQKLVSTQKLESLGVLAGGIAHDFNNLLVSMLGYATLGRRGIDVSAEPAELLRGSRSRRPMPRISPRSCSRMRGVTPWHPRSCPWMSC